MSAGATSASFYFMGTRTGTVTLTAAVGAISKTQTETINPGSPTVLMFSPAAQTVTAGSCAQLSLLVQDANGNNSPVSSGQTVNLSANPAAGFTFYSNNTCGTSTTTVTVTSGQSSATFYAKSTKSGNVTVTATKSGFTDGTLALTVNPGAASKVVFLTGPQAVLVGACSGSATVDLQDAFSNSSPASSGATVNLTSNTGNITFYSDSSCMNATTSAAVASNQSSASFYFKDSTVEGVTITAASGSLTSGAQTETINPLPPTMLAFTTPERSAVAGTCSGLLLVETQAQGGVSTTVTTPTTVSFGGAPAGLTFYSNSSCTTAVTQATLAVGQGNTTFYFKGAAAGAYTITASSPGLTSATQNATVTIPPTKLLFTSPARTATAGTCSPLVTVQSADGTNTVAPVAWGGSSDRVGPRSRNPHD